MTPIDFGKVFPVSLPAFRSTFFYVTPGSTTTGAQTQGALRGVPFVVQRATVFDRIGAEVTTIGEAGSKIRLGIYSELDGIPGPLVLDAGQINGDSATYQTVTIEQLLGPGIYWLASVAQSCPATPPTTRVLSGSAVQMGYSANPSSTTLIAYSDSGTYSTGGLPASWTIGSSQGNSTRVGLRAD